MGLVLALAGGCASTAPEPAAPRSSRNPWAEDPRVAGPRSELGVRTVPVPEEISLSSLRWVVEASLSERHWDVDDSKPGRVAASVQSKGSGEFARILVTYAPGAIRIEKVAGEVTPQRYERWVRLLVANINRHIAPLGSGQSPPPAAGPPPEELD
jgi:hypothetical protein